MSHVVESFTSQQYGYQVQIVLDEDASNPYQEYDCVSQVYHWHRRYDLGTKIEPMGQEDLTDYLAQRGDKVLAIKPLHLLDHSGISVSVGSFGCSWDSGQVGWVVITEQRCQQVDYPYRTADKLDEVILAEVKQFDQYLTGQVYGYKVMYEGECVDSCWGYYDLESVKDDARYAAEADYRPKGVYGRTCLDAPACGG